MFLFRELSQKNKNFVFAGIALTAGYFIYKCKFHTMCFYFNNLISRSRVKEAKSCWSRRSAVYLSAEIWGRYRYTICTCCRTVSDSIKPNLILRVFCGHQGILNHIKIHTKGPRMEWTGRSWLGDSIRT